MLLHSDNDHICNILSINCIHRFGVSPFGRLTPKNEVLAVINSIDQSI